MTATSSAHDKLVGRKVGEFVLRRRIGEGGFGVVYRAEQPALEREAVVKRPCGGNQTRAAQMLGIGRRTLISRVKEFGLARPRRAR